LAEVQAAHDRIQSLRQSTEPPPEPSKDAPAPTPELSHTNGPRG
jgi:hypothetical protein